MHDYYVLRNGIEVRVQLTDEDAKRVGARPVEDVESVRVKSRTPANKARTPENK